MFTAIYGGGIFEPPAAILHTPCQCVSLTCTIKLKKSEYNFYFHEVYAYAMCLRITAQTCLPATSS